MALKRNVVITGMGIVSPIGIGAAPFWSSLAEGRSGIRPVELFVHCGGLSPLGAEVTDFDPKQYVRPRKSLKVMSRDIQLAFAAADLAYDDGGLRAAPPDPDRIGIVMGADMIACELPDLAPTFRDCITDGRFHFERWGEKAMADIFPLWMLKYLPNMPACHIGIAEDIRGPTNTIVLGEVSSLAAVAEAVRALERGQVDLMLAGGVGSRVHPIIWGRELARQFSRSTDVAAGGCRPFDARRDGLINGEGAATFVLETEEGAPRRGAKIRARVLGFAAAFESSHNGTPPAGKAIRAAIRQALCEANLTPGDIGHVNAHGLGTTLEDALEAQAIRDTLGDVPVTAPKSFFGDLGAGGGAVEMAVSVLAFEHGLVPRTLNYEYPDPQCPVNVIHGQSLPLGRPTALLLNHTLSGQAIALVLAGGDDKVTR